MKSIFPLHMLVTSLFKLVSKRILTKMDQYESIFDKVAMKRKHIDSTDQWDEYLDELHEAGLIQSSEIPLLCNYAFSSPHRKTFPEIQEAIVRVFGGQVLEHQDDAKKSATTMDETMQRVVLQADAAQALSSEWKIGELNESQTYQLIGIIQKLVAREHEIQHLISKEEERQIFRLQNQAVLTLFWEPLAYHHVIDSTDEGVVTNAATFQQHNLTAIEKILYRRKIQQVKVLQSGGGVNELLKHDNQYALLLEKPQAGVVLLEGFSAKLRDQSLEEEEAEEEQLLSRSERNVVVVSMSKEGATSHTTESVFNRVSAHRQLASSPYIQRFLGLDLTSSDSDTFVYYEYLDETQSLGEFIASRPLSEESHLFRHWSRSILYAFRDLHEQCSHTWTQDISIDNIFIKNGGMGLVLGGFQYGHSIEAKNVRAYASREAELVSDYAAILHRILCGTTRPQSATKEEYAQYIAGAELPLRYADLEDGSDIHVSTSDTLMIQLNGDNEDDPWQVQDFPKKSSILKYIQTDEVGTFTFKVGAGGGKMKLEFATTADEDDHPDIENTSSSGCNKRMQVCIHVHERSLSPTIQAILASCVGGIGIGRQDQKKKNKTFLPVCTFRHLVSHPYFQKSKLEDDDEMVIAEYETRMAEHEWKRGS